MDIKAKQTKQVLSPAQATRLKTRAEKYFEQHKDATVVIATIDGNLFEDTDDGRHAAWNHAQKLAAKYVIEISKSETGDIEGGNAAEFVASGKPNPSQALRINTRAKAYFDSNPDEKTVLATADGNLFKDDETGEHAAKNHAVKLTNKNTFEVQKGTEIQGDADTGEVKNEPTKGQLKVEQLLNEGKFKEALTAAMGLPDAEKASLKPEVNALLTEASKELDEAKKNAEEENKGQAPVA